MKEVIVFVLCALVCIAADDSHEQSQSEDAFCNSTISAANAINTEYRLFQDSLRIDRENLNKALLRGTETMTDIQHENLKYFQERYVEWDKQYEDIQAELRAHSEIAVESTFKSAISNFQQNITTIISTTKATVQESYSHLFDVFAKYLTLIDEGLSSDLTRYYDRISTDYVVRGLNDAKHCACQKLRQISKSSLDKLSAAATCANAAVSELELFDATLYTMMDLAKNVTWSIHEDVKKCLADASNRTAEEIDVCLRVQMDSLSVYSESEVFYARNIAITADTKLRIVRLTFGACIARTSMEFVTALKSFEQKFAQCADWTNDDLVPFDLSASLYKNLLSINTQTN